MTATAEIRDPRIVREELEDLLAYLNGLPEEIRQSGAFRAYEQRAGELSRELVLTDLLLTLMLPDEQLITPGRALDYGRVYDSLASMTRSYELAAERSVKTSRRVQWALLAASAASVVSAFAAATLVMPFSIVAASLAIYWVAFLSERTRKQEIAAMRLAALRGEIEQSFGLAGKVLPPSEYYSATTKRIEALLREINAADERSRPLSSPM